MSSENRSALPRVTEDEARIWVKGEEVAMHFNTMISGFRLKALSAITLSGGLVGAVLLTRTNGPPPWFNFMVFSGAMVLLAVLWWAIRAIDVGYYQRLLAGAVSDLLRIERESGGAIQLSTMIEKCVDGTMAEVTDRFYAIPLKAFLGAASLAAATAAHLGDTDHRSSVVAIIGFTLGVWAFAPLVGIRRRSPRPRRRFAFGAIALTVFAGAAFVRAAPYARASAVEVVAQGTQGNASASTDTTSQDACVGPDQ